MNSPHYFSAKALNDEIIARLLKDEDRLGKMVTKTKTQAAVSRKANLKTKQLSHACVAEYKEADNGIIQSAA